jgi:transposase-like protein
MIDLHLRPCPHCGSSLTSLIGVVEADIAILGTDEEVYHCDDCRTEWVQEKGGTRREVLNPGHPAFGSEAEADGLDANDGR